ncbi:hypothetical protein NDU88_006564 [Pleurodeles waltl]|uniref:Uncharacterized protein n=1 Tax=Pleurodeles waltl TaxID=8319 RepID=A0AAV7QIA3_PLEWA|nr:hypothetical protein NDU88_006564 [Pleurodeles waltl]
MATQLAICGYEEVRRMQSTLEEPEDGNPEEENVEIEEEMEEKGQATDLELQLTEEEEDNLPKRERPVTCQSKEQCTLEENFGSHLPPILLLCLTPQALVESLKALMDLALNIEYCLRERKLEKRRSRVQSPTVAICPSTRRPEENRSEYSASTEEGPMQIDVAHGPLSEA